VWVEDDPLTTEGAAWLRGIGVNLIVLSPETYEDVGVDNGYIGPYTLFSRLRDVRLPTGTIPAAIFDPTIDRYLLDDEMSPEMAAVYTAADLAVWRDWLDAKIGPVDGNSILLGLPAGGVLGHDRIGRLVELAGATGAATFTDITDLLRSTDPQSVDDRPITLTLAPQQPVDLTTRASTVADLAARQATVTSMLIEDVDARSDRWQRTIGTLRSSSITDAQVEATAATLRTQFDAITTCIEGPDSFTFTMNGQDTTLHANILNRCEEPLLVKVALSATQNKMAFPDGNVVQARLERRVITDVPIRVRARTNGSSTIIMSIYAPADTAPLAPPTVIKAEVSALTGLAQVLTGGALLILLTWWVRNLRRNRRASRSATALATHPVTRVADAIPETDPVAPLSDAAGSPTRSPGHVATATTSNATITAAAAIATPATTADGETAAANERSTTLPDS
jgi:hypothetical protein